MLGFCLRPDVRGHVSLIMGVRPLLAACGVCADEVHADGVRLPSERCCVLVRICAPGGLRRL